MYPSAAKREERIKEIVGQIRRNESKGKKNNPIKCKVLFQVPWQTIVYIVVKITRLGAKAMF